MRVILLISLTSFFLLGVVSANDTPKLPSRNADVVVPLLEHISKGENYSDIEKILGEPDMDVGSGIYIYVFRLDDFTSVTVGTPDRKSIFSIQRTGRNINGVQKFFSN